MSIYKNGKLIAGGRQCMPLLSFMWTDHVLNNASWLRADTFSWQPGLVYIAVYQHLTADITGKTLQSETISGTTIQFYLADDGHKICPASEESNVMAIYNATGVAWYYIIDTTNQIFKLPRTRFGFTGIRSGVGNYVEAGLPNITGHTRAANNVYYGDDSAGALYRGGAGYCNGQDYNVGGTYFDASRSNPIYGNSDTVQPKATEMYLYFYVGNFTQTALENTAGLNAELFNDKVDVGHEVIAFQEPTAANNYTWYRKYADGWVEQGGISDASTSGVSVTLPIEMTDANYTVVVGNGETTTNPDYTAYCSAQNRTATSFSFYVKGYGGNGTSYRCCWQVSGMAA